MSEYIDREAAKKKHCDICRESNICYRSNSCADLKIFDAIPAADVRPVVRGKWEAVDFHSVKCSKCGFVMDIMKVDVHVLNHANFCPNCGAEMKEDV